MVKRHPRWFVSCVIVALGIMLIPTFFLYRGHVLAASKVASTPSITLSPKSLHAGRGQVTVTGTGFTPNSDGSFLFDGNSVEGSFSCDGNGDCSGSMLPPPFLVSGPHTVTAYNGYGESAQAILTILADFSLSPHSGNAWTNLYLQGNGLGSSETLKVYWGDPSTGILVGTPTTTSWGTLGYNFSVPGGVGPGKYTITVVRSLPGAPNWTSWFIYVPPKIHAQAGMHPGEWLKFGVIGFEPYEQVTLSWNANGGQILQQFTTDQNGSGGQSFVPPSAPTGSYTLTAKGSSSGLIATKPLNIGPGIDYGPDSPLPGSTITVSGGGFPANDPLTIYLQQKSNGTVQTTTDSSGNFTANLTLPKSYNQKITYHLYAIDSSGLSTRTPFAFAQPIIDLGSSNITYNNQLDLTGVGYLPGEKVALYWNYHQPGQLLVGMFKADNQGNFSYIYNAPSDPDLGTVIGGVIGQTSTIVETASLQERGLILVNPPFANPGQTVQIQGGGMSANQSVTLKSKGQSVGTTTSDGTGLFIGTMVIPDTQKYGSTGVEGIGSPSGTVIGGSFEYLKILTINPTTGKSGTKITLYGSHYEANTVVDITFYVNSQDGYNFPAVTTSAKGTFTTTITAIPGLISGEVCLIWGTYQYMGYPPPDGGMATFTVQ